MTPIRCQWLTNAVAVTAALLFVAACSTPQARIEKDPALYAAFPPDVQANVRRGKIDIGYTSDMVFVAWGKPDKKREIIDNNGSHETWIYLGSRQVFVGYETVEVARPAGGGRVGGVYFEQRPRFRTVNYERASVTFSAGKVQRIVASNEPK